MMEEKQLPESWTECPLGDLANYINGRAFKPVEWKTAGLPIIRIQNLTETRANYNFSDQEHDPRFLVKNGDLLIAWSASLGAFIWEGQEAWLNQHIFRVEPNREIVEKRFLYYAVQQAIKELYDKSHGSGMVHVTKPVFEAHLVPLAPLNEQRRIVEKLDELMERFAAARTKLERVPRLLAHFRRAVLAAACSGALTRDWRAENDDVESRTVKMGDLFERGDIFDGPFGSNLKSSDYTAEGVRVIRLENIGYLSFLGEKKTFVSQEKYETLKRHTVGEGDLIFSSFVADNVRCCVLPKLETLAIAKADCFCLRPKPKVVNAHFLQFQLSTRNSYDALVENVHGATRPRINTTQLKSLEIELPPLPEQREIVRRLNELFALADSLEARFAKAQAFFDRMPAAILAKAFRGELVSQDPDDEPAQVLAARLRAAQTTKTKPAPVKADRAPKADRARRSARVTQGRKSSQNPTLPGLN